MKKKLTPKPTPTRRLRVPKPVLAMAAPPAEHPVVSIEKLKGGELNWSIRVPGKSLPQAISRALAEAKRLHADLDAWQREMADAKYKDLLDRKAATMDAGNGK